MQDSDHPGTATEAYVARVASWVAERRAEREPPLVVGVHGPQGAGKSTLCAAVAAALEVRGLRACAVSIDDFYLTRGEQQALAAAHPGNRYLEHRGYPGTHDVALGARVLALLRRGARGEVRVPVYDKSAHGGRGDRAPPEAWNTVATPLDVVMVEGWMLAFRPVDAVPEPDLAAPNAALAAYEPWRRALDALVVLEVAGGDLEQIVRWRVDAERARRATGAPGLSDAEAHDYVSRFLPAYRLWTPGLEGSPSGLRSAEPRPPTLRIALGADRLPRG